MIKLIIFDAGNVLYSVSQRDITNALEMFFSKHNMKHSPKMDEVWNEIAPLVNRGKITLKEAHERWLEGIGLDKSLQTEWSKYDIEMLKSLKIKSGVIDTLKELKKNYRLAVLSDCPHNKKLKLITLKEIGVDRFFDEIFTSYDIGFVKPEKGAYLTVLKHFNVKPDESVFISDHEDEIEGAKEVGIKTIFFNNRKNDKADFCIRKFP